MSVLDYIDKLRARPEAERQRLVVWFSILATLILLVLWLLNLRFIWQNNQEEVEVESTDKGLTSAGLEFFNNTATRIKTGWQTITNQN